jgi:hypothetical protein
MDILGKTIILPTSDSFCLQAMLLIEQTALTMDRFSLGFYSLGPTQTPASVTEVCCMTWEEKGTVQATSG